MENMEENSEKIGNIWKKDKLKSEKIWEIWKESKLNSEKIWKIQYSVYPPPPYLFSLYSLSFHYFLPYFPYHFTIFFCIF
jgi:hypothetical protein